MDIDLHTGKTLSYTATGVDCPGRL